MRTTVVAAFFACVMGATVAQGPWAERALKKFGAEPDADVCRLPDWNRDLMDHVASSYKKMIGRSGNVKK